VFSTLRFSRIPRKVPNCIEHLHAPRGGTGVRGDGIVPLSHITALMSF